MIRNKKEPKEKKYSDTSIMRELWFLILKIGILIVLLLITFIFVFGIYRNIGDSMFPAVKDGDLIFYYRLENNYAPSDVVVVKKGTDTQIMRIIAKSGDTVDITEEGVIINGNLQQEPFIYTETLPYREGITFPMTLGKDEYFVLSDSRTSAIDSRIYGAVKKNEIKGIVITLLRRRGI